jgi:hypothetical protein
MSGGHIITRLPTDMCPSCSERLDAASGTELPRPGDFSVCFECGEVLRFTDALGVVAAGAAELERELLPWQLRQLRGMQRDIRERRREPPQ